MFLVLTQIIDFKFAHEVCTRKKEDKSTEMLPPLINAHVQCRESEKVRKGSNFKEDESALPL